MALRKGCYDTLKAALWQGQSCAFGKRWWSDDLGRACWGEWMTG
ncbi:hypothetical protein [Prevotella sp.]